MELNKDKIKETLSRSKFSNEIEIELYGLYEVCENISDSKLFEYIPIKIVACFEAFFRCVYTEIMDDPRFRGRLGNVKQLKNTKFNFEVVDKLMKQYRNRIKFSPSKDPYITFKLADQKMILEECKEFLKKL